MRVRHGVFNHANARFRPAICCPGALAALAFVDRRLPRFSWFSMGEPPPRVRAARYFHRSLRLELAQSWRTLTCDRLVVSLALVSADVPLRNGQAAERRSRVAQFYRAVLPL